jgi:hypothetical protein
MVESKVKAAWAEFRPPLSAFVYTAARFASIYMKEDDLDDDHYICIQLRGYLKLSVTLTNWTIGDWNRPGIHTYRGEQNSW